MDIFYKPPLQRPDECKRLEENYMNCLMQKALKDKVITNRCVMDSILWFHTECPKAAAEFDDKDAFKLKFRRWFAMQRNTAEALLTNSEEDVRLQTTFERVNYPEDVVPRQEVRAFPNEYKHIDPNYKLDGEDEWDNDVEYEHLPPGQRKYLDEIPGFPNRDTVEVSDSAKFSNQH